MGLCTSFGLCLEDPEDENSWIPCQFIIFITKSLLNDETVAHEYGHAVFSHEGLWPTENCTGEQKAIRESLADLFSAFYSQAFQKDTEEGKWLLEEDIDWGEDEWGEDYVALRDLKNPPNTNVYTPSPDRLGATNAYN